MCFSFALTKQPCSHSTPSYWDEETVGWRAPTFFPRIDPGKKDSRSEDTRVAADIPVRPTLGSSTETWQECHRAAAGLLQPPASNTRTLQAQLTRPTAFPAQHGAPTALPSQVSSNIYSCQQGSCLLHFTH